MDANQQRQRGVCLMETACIPSCHERLSVTREDAALHGQAGQLRINRPHKSAATCCRCVELFLREFHVLPPLCSGPAAIRWVCGRLEGQKPAVANAATGPRGTILFRWAYPLFRMTCLGKNAVSRQMCLLPAVAKLPDT